MGRKLLNRNAKERLPIHARLPAEAVVSGGLGGGSGSWLRLIKGRENGRQEKILEDGDAEKRVQRRGIEKPRDRDTIGLDCNGSSLGGKELG